MRDWRPFLLVITALVVVLDRVTKLYVAAHIELWQVHTVVPHVFWISHVENTGAAFSLFSNSASPQRVRVGLIAFSVLAVAAVLVLLLRWGKRLTLSSVGMALILGGAAGNLYDRIRLRYVIDFIEIHFGSYHFPDFNVADSCITVGALLLILDLLLQPAGQQA